MISPNYLNNFKNLLMLFLSVVIIILGIKYGELRSMKLLEMERSANSDRKVIAGLMEDLKNATSLKRRLTLDLTELNKQLDVQTPPKPAPPRAGRSPFADGENRMLLKAFIGMTLDRDYPLLFSKLNLSNVQLTALRDLWSAWIIRSQWTSLPYSPSDPIQPDQEFRLNLETLIGPSQSKLVIASIADPASWDKIQAFDKKLRYEASPLSDQQFELMKMVFTAEIQAYPVPTDIAGINTAYQMKLKSNDRIIDQAKDFLNVNQLKSLSDHLNAEAAIQHVAFYDVMTTEKIKASPAIK